MPKQKTTTSAPPPRAALAPSAAKLIAAAKQRTAVEAPSDDGMAELRALVEYNDTVPCPARVSADDALEMLRGYGWARASRGALDALCKRAFGRKSYGTK